jgi:hypothetical protein
VARIPPGRGGYVGPHSVMPPDARWLKKNESPDGREGLYRSSNDNRIEETWYVPELILPDDGSPPFVATQSFHSTACVIGKDMLRRAARKVMVDGALVSNPALIKWRMTSRFASGDGNRWPVPVPTIVGRFGEANGPTADQVGLAAKLRKAFQQGLPMGEEPPTPPSEAIERTPRPVITSGLPIVHEVETPPPHVEYEGPDDDPYGRSQVDFDEDPAF